MRRDKISLAYLGASEFSAVFLEKLINDKNIPVIVKLVVTQPDRPVGRRGVITPTPVKLIAEKYNIPFFTESLRAPASSIGEKLKKIDLALLYAYGEIIPLSCLKAPKYGFWNIHPSLLPKYRGASPIAYPLMMGDRESGVCIIQMDQELDHGPLLAQKTEQVSPTETKKNLEERLTNISYELFSEIVPKIGNNLELKNQLHEKATYTRKLAKNDGYISVEFIKKALCNALIITADLPKPIIDYLSKNSTPLPQTIKPAGETFFNFFRAMHPWPGIWTKINIKGVEKRLKITEMNFSQESSTPSITHVQLEGKNEVDYLTFKNAYGDIFLR